MTISHGASFLLCIRTQRIQRNDVQAQQHGPNNMVMVHTSTNINQTATETPEKVQSKQTVRSHDSHRITGPHRSQASWRNPTKKSLRHSANRHLVKKQNVVHTPGAAAFKQQLPDYRQILQVCCFSKLTRCQDTSSSGILYPSHNTVIKKHDKQAQLSGMLHC